MDPKQQDIEESTLKVIKGELPLKCAEAKLHLKYCDKCSKLNFESFLNDKFMENYLGNDDDAPDKFNQWLENLDTQEVMDFAQEALNKL